MVQRWGGPEQVGAVLGALRSVELVGPKLALQGWRRGGASKATCRAHRSSEWHVAIRAGERPRAGCLQLIGARCKAEGAATTPETQAVMDAVAHMERSAVVCHRITSGWSTGPGHDPSAGKDAQVSPWTSTHRRAPGHRG